ELSAERGLQFDGRDNVIGGLVGPLRQVRLDPLLLSRGKLGGVRTGLQDLGALRGVLDVVFEVRLKRSAVGLGRGDGLRRRCPLRATRWPRVALRACGEDYETKKQNLRNFHGFSFIRTFS